IEKRALDIIHDTRREFAGRYQPAQHNITGVPILLDQASDAFSREHPISRKQYLRWAGSVGAAQAIPTARVSDLYEMWRKLRRQEIAERYEGFKSDARQSRVLRDLQLGLGYVVADTLLAEAGWPRDFSASGFDQSSAMQARAFVAGIVESQDGSGPEKLRRGIARLDPAWKNPRNLPTEQELKRPETWLRRTNRLR
ncbi:MAG: hypothetical protein ACRDQZ_20340, partial [Mycobacteriales bacterium]